MKKSFLKKYAMLLTYEDLADSSNNKFIIVELQQDLHGNFTKILKPDLSTRKKIYDAYNDVSLDGVNRYFYDNGIFLYNNRGNIYWKKDS